MKGPRAAGFAQLTYAVTYPDEEQQRNGKRQENVLYHAADATLNRNRQWLGELDPATRRWRHEAPQMVENSKSEYRNPKQIQNTKIQKANDREIRSPGFGQF